MPHKAGFRAFVTESGVSKPRRAGTRKARRCNRAFFSPERQRARATTFGLAFGMGAKRFLVTAKGDDSVRLTLDDAREAKRKLLEAYPSIGHRHRREAGDCEKGNFETRTLLSRRRVVEPDRGASPSSPSSWTPRCRGRPPTS